MKWREKIMPSRLYWEIHKIRDWKKNSDLLLLATTKNRIFQKFS